MAFYTPLIDQIKSIGRIDGVLIKLEAKGWFSAFGLHHSIAGVVLMALGVAIGPWYALAFAVSAHYADKEIGEAMKRTPHKIELFDWLTVTLVSFGLAWLATTQTL